MLGLPASKVFLVAHSPEWQSFFETEKQGLEGAIGPYVLDIQHIGSMSIPDISAKPILDISIAVASFEVARVCIKPLEQLGYEYKGENGIPRRHYFVKGEPRTHHIHMVEHNSDDWKTTLFFRDYLRQYPEVAREYAELKLQLAQQFPTDGPLIKMARMPLSRASCKRWERSAASEGAG